MQSEPSNGAFKIITKLSAVWQGNHGHWNLKRCETNSMNGQRLREPTTQRHIRNTNSRHRSRPTSAVRRIIQIMKRMQVISMVIRTANVVPVVGVYGREDKPFNKRLCHSAAHTASTQIHTTVIKPQVWNKANVSMSAPVVGFRITSPMTAMVCHTIHRLVITSSKPDSSFMSTRTSRMSIAYACRLPTVLIGQHPNNHLGEAMAFQAHSK